jgi:hypothetical protein
MPGDIHDTSPNFDEIDYEAIAEFFHKKGSVELISVIGDGMEGYRFDELHEVLELSRGYLNKRLQEAQDLRLIIPDQVSRDGSVRRVWVLTSVGVYIYRLMSRTELTYIHSQLIDIRKKYEEKRKSFLEQIDDTESVEEYFRQEYVEYPLKLEELQPRQREIFWQLMQSEEHKAEDY